MDLPQRKIQSSGRKFLFKQMAKRSQSGASFASFSSAGILKRGLSRVGFELRKERGFGKKREMLCGALPREQRAPGFIESLGDKCRVLVIGSGLAGAAVAEAFSRRDCALSVFERGLEVAADASGNLSGVVMPHISREPDWRTRFSLCSFFYLLRLLSGFQRQNIDLSWQKTGLVRLATNARLKSLLAKLPLGAIDDLVCKVSKEEASQILGVSVVSDGLYFPAGGFLSPRKFCKALLRGLDVRLGVEVARIARNSRSWVLYDSQGEELGEGDVVVVCSACSSKMFSQLEFLPLESVRGQVVHFPENKQTAALRAVLCYEGYLAPAISGTHVIGATFEHGNASRKLNAEQQINLLCRLKEYWPDFSFDEDLAYPGRVGFRASTPDRLPMIGPVPDVANFSVSYAPVKPSRVVHDYNSEVWLSGLYASVGHGSHGLLSCPLAGELIASMVFQEPLPVDNDLITQLNPARFLVRSLNRAGIGTSVSRQNIR